MPFLSSRQRASTARCVNPSPDLGSEAPANAWSCDRFYDMTVAKPRPSVTPSNQEKFGGRGFAGWCWMVMGRPVREHDHAFIASAKGTGYEALQRWLA